MRFFFALWPDEATRDKLAGVCAQLPPGTGKVISRQNLHITLSFLGTLDTPIVENLCRDAASIKGRPFTLQLDQMGWWRKPQVFWIGTADTPKDLLVLVVAVNGLLEAHGILPDDRPYAPHMTIARKVAGKPREFAFAPVTWPVSSFSLVQSRTLPAGAEYEVIATWPFS